MALTTLVAVADVGGVTQNIRAPASWLAQSVSLEHPTGRHAPLTHTVPSNLPWPAPDGPQSRSVAQGRMHAPATHCSRTSPIAVAHSPSDAHPVCVHKLVVESQT
jgi:hypothetical protein